MMNEVSHSSMIILVMEQLPIIESQPIFLLISSLKVAQRVWGIPSVD